jgi:hypothetical protein
MGAWQDVPLDIDVPCSRIRCNIDRLVRLHLRGQCYPFRRKYLIAKVERHVGEARWPGGQRRFRGRRRLPLGNERWPERPFRRSVPLIVRRKHHRGARQSDTYQRRSPDRDALVCFHSYHGTRQVI